MKEFLEKKVVCLENTKDKTYDYFIRALLILVLYRFFIEGIIPNIQGTIVFYPMFLPILLVFACVFLCYGFFYIMDKWFKTRDYLPEESLIDGLLLGILLPIRTPIFIIVIACFTTIIIGRYVMKDTPYFVPVLIGIIGAMVFSIWLTICGFFKTQSFQLLFEFTEIFSVEKISLSSIWFGLVESWVSKTSPSIVLITFFYLISKKAIKWRIPVYFIISYIVLLILSNFFISTTFVEILKKVGANNILFLAIFVASDKRSTPVTASGQIVFSVFLAFFTYFGSFFITPFLSMILSILLLNLLVPILDYFGSYYQLKFCNEFWR